MRRLPGFLLRLYPRRYRQEYGEEWTNAALGILARGPLVRSACRLLVDTVRSLPGAYLRELNPRHFMFGAGRDAQQAGRMLWRHPRFSLTCVAVLAIGIGVNSAAFNVTNAAVLRPLSHASPEELVVVWGYWRASEFREAPLSPPQVQALREQTSVLTDAGALWASSAAVSGEEHAEQIGVGRVTPSLFTTLGTTPQLGRLLHDRDAADPAAEGGRAP